MVRRDRWEPWSIVTAILAFSPLLIAVAPALIIPLSLYVLSSIPRAVTAMWKSPRLRRALLVGVAVVIALVILDLTLAEGILYLETHCVTTEDGRRKLHYWFQILTGNWSERAAYTIPSYGFSLTISTAVMLNLGPPLAMFTLIAWVSKHVNILRKGQTMLMIQALSEKEDAEKQALYSEFGDDPETMARINAAFEKSMEAWRPQVTAVFGRTEAENFFRLLNQRVPRPG